MNLYLWVKLIHLLSATILFGTGLGIAFFMLKAYNSGDPQAMRVTTRHVVLADWIFTMPAVLTQFATGLWLTHVSGISFASLWFVSVIGVFVLVGCCWIPVVWIQIRIREIVATGGERSEVRGLMSAWMALGALAFGGVLLLFYLMVSRAGVDRLIVG